MNDFIKKRQYKRYLVCQPYFVWHSLDNKIDFEEIEDENDLIELVWGDEVQEESLEETANQKIARTFRVIDEHLMGELKKQGEVVFMNSKDPIEKRLEQTKSLLNSGKIIVKPVFEYRNAIATPFAFDTKTRTIINLKYSMKFKNKDFIDYYYDYQIVSKTTPVNECVLYLPINKNYKKGEIELFAVNGSTHRASLPQTSAEMVLLPFLPALETGVISWEYFNNKPTRIKSEFILPDFDGIIDGIEKARNIDYIEESIELDARKGQFGTNPEWQNLLLHFNSFLYGYSGHLFKKDPMFSDIFLATSIPGVDAAIESVERLFAQSKLPKKEMDLTLWTTIKVALHKQASIIDKNRLSQYEEIKKSNKVSWYDFEGFSLPIAPLDNVSPYQQVAFQVSVIITEKNIEIEKENLVFDPKTFSSSDFIKIIQSIYRSDVEAYVVYNKSYEITRLKEMHKILTLENHVTCDEFKLMLDAIEAKTVDLFDLFKVLSHKKIPPILLYDQKAKASIKNVEKHITANMIDLPRKIYPYKELEVKNGAMAMEIAINRALGIIGDNEWKVREEELKKYCENDVRAMIMVYDFVDWFYKGGKY